MSTEEKLNAVLDYGEKLKMRAENDILFDKIKAHINLVIIVIMILYYFRHIILETTTPKVSNFEPFKLYNQKIQPQIIYESYPKNISRYNMRFLN